MRKLKRGDVRNKFPNMRALQGPIYSCFDKGCLTKVFKRTRQYRLVLWVVRVWLCVIEFEGDSAIRKEKA